MSTEEKQMTDERETKESAGRMPTSGEWRRGQVALVDWSRFGFSAQLAFGLLGEVMVCDTKSSLGFDMQGGGHSNWIAFVRGRESVVAVPGCKVNSIAYDVTEHPNPDFLVVP